MTTSKTTKMVRKRKGFWFCFGQSSRQIGGDWRWCVLNSFPFPTEICSVEVSNDWLKARQALHVRSYIPAGTEEPVFVFRLTQQFQISMNTVISLCTFRCNLMDYADRKMFSREAEQNDSVSLMETQYTAPIIILTQKKIVRMATGFGSGRTALLDRPSK